MIRALVLVALSALAGCYTPSCEATCRHLRGCDLDVERLTQDECVLACDAQTKTYDDLGDDVRAEALKAHRRCVSAATCDELADGVCYDPEIFPY